MGTGSTCSWDASRLALVASVVPLAYGFSTQGGVENGPDARGESSGPSGPGGPKGGLLDRDHRRPVLSDLCSV